MTRCKFCFTHIKEATTICPVCGLDIEKRKADFSVGEKKKFKGLRLLTSAGNLFFFFIIILFFALFAELTSRSPFNLVSAIFIALFIIYIFLWIGIRKLLPLSWKLSIAVTVLNLVGTIVYLFAGYFIYKFDFDLISLTFFLVFMFIPAGTLYCLINPSSKMIMQKKEKYLS